ncbi:MAG TPA: VanZ family protein [Thermodesulfobacteriota bacterium]|nr:VanZ family protein [Thermodesulfobacteriota bacterium]HNU01155.1 VanZ family protein [Acidobacteriota bacterium]
MVTATSIPGDQIPTLPVPGLDKVVHALLYGGLAFLLQRWLRGGLRRPPARPLLLAATVCGIYAVLDELHQLAIPRRTFSFGDLAADAMGIGIGLAVAAAIVAQRRKAAKAVAVGGVSAGRVDG